MTAVDFSPDRYDLVVIGSGPAGEKGAAQAAYFGKSVAVVERMPDPGGASLHTGTLPSKTLREAALYLTGFRRRELYGMTLHLDRKKSLRQLTGRLQVVTETQRRQIRRNLERHRIEMIRGNARFLDGRTIGVFDADGTSTRRLTFDAALIAVGSSPLPPRGVTFADPDVEDSDSILDLDRIPKTLAVVGGGVIGCEYASIFAALGTRVTLIEGRERLLAFLDGELSASLEIALERMGCEVLLGDAVESIRREPGLASNALRLALGSGRVLTADKILFSAGRRGNTEGLGLEAAGVTFDPKGRIPVGPHFETNVRRIYAAGDVIGFPALAATSMEQGRVAVCDAFDIPFKTSVASQFPYGVYTIPEISMIGATEEELKAKGTPYEVGRARYENNARGQITGDPDGFVKLVFDPDSKMLLGAHLLGGGATELVHIAQMVMLKKGGLDDFLHSVFNFPTLAECFKYAAYDGLQRLSHRANGAAHSPQALKNVSARVDVAPPGREWFVGVGLSDPASREKRPVTVAFMDRWRRVHFMTWTFEPGGEHLIPDDVAADGFVLAVSGRQGIPKTGQKTREADRALRVAGGPRGASARAAAARDERLWGSVALFAALRAGGLGLAGEAPWASTSLLEVCPAAVWPVWADGRVPDKGLPAGRRMRYDLLRGQGVELPVGCDAMTHDRLDAAAAALTAYLWTTGNTRELGEPPVWDPEAGCLREGFIVTP